MQEYINTKKRVKDFYERYPCGGASAKGDMRHKIHPWMLKIFDYEKWHGKLLLDVGCGTGIDMAVYCMNGAAVVGIDLAKKPLLIAKEHISDLEFDNAFFVRCDLECLPIRSRVFDMTYSIGVLHHTPNPEKGVREIFRTLKNHARTIVLLYNRCSVATVITELNQVFYRLFGDYLLKVVKFLYRGKMNLADIAAWREMCQHPLIRYFSSQEAIRLFEDAGFRILINEKFDSMWPISRFVPAMEKHDAFRKLFGRFVIAKCEKT